MAYTVFIYTKDGGISVRRTLRGTAIAISTTAALGTFWVWIASVLPLWGHAIFIGILAIIAIVDPCLTDIIDEEPSDTSRVDILDLVLALPGALVTGSVTAFLAVIFPDVASQTVAFWCGFAAWCGFFAFLTHLHYKPKMDADSAQKSATIP